MVVADASDAGREPRLTGYAALTANELAGYGTRFSSSVRVPFTMIASEDPQCGTSACAGAAGRVDINVRTSPFYYISRQESYVDLNLYARNLTSRDQNLGPRNVTVGWSTEDSKSFSQQVGLELGVEAKIYSAKLTVQLAWSQSSTVSKNGSQTETFGPYVIPPGEFLQVLGVSTTFRATSELGTVLPSTLGGTTTGTIYLSWPEAP
jgi:hypothetical protein